MPRIVNFADGFTSSSPPVIIGASQEIFDILNNQSSFTNFSGLILDKDQYQTVKMFCEIERSSSSGSYRQAIELVFVYKSTWSFTTGLSSGDTLLEETLSSGELVIFSINATTGQVSYKSGNLSGTSYTGKLKASIDRILNA